MIVTFLEAHVPAEKGAALQAAFEGAEPTLSIHDVVVSAGAK